MNKLLPKKTQLKELQAQVPKELILKKYSDIETLQNADDLASEMIQIENALQNVTVAENELVMKVKEHFKKIKDELEHKKQTQNELMIKYVANHDADVFPKAKTRELHYVTFTKKTSETVKTDVDKFAKDTIELIKEKFPDKKDELIRVKEEIKTTDFKKLTDDQLKTVNAKREQNINYSYKLKTDKPIE